MGRLIDGIRLYQCRRYFKMFYLMAHFCINLGIVEKLIDGILLYQRSAVWKILLVAHFCINKGTVGNFLLIDDTHFASAIWFVSWGCN
jgi:hypothetical protein